MSTERWAIDDKSIHLTIRNSNNEQKTIFIALEISYHNIMLTRLALPKTKQGIALLRLLISHNQLHDSQIHAQKL